MAELVVIAVQRCSGIELRANTQGNKGRAPMGSRRGER